MWKWKCDENTLNAQTQSNELNKFNFANRQPDSSRDMNDRLLQRQTVTQKQADGESESQTGRHTGWQTAIKNSFFLISAQSVCAFRQSRNVQFVVIFYVFESIAVPKQVGCFVNISTDITIKVEIIKAKQCSFKYICR